MGVFFIVYKFRYIFVLGHLNCDIFTVMISLVLFIHFLNNLFVEIKLREIFRISGEIGDLRHNNNECVYFCNLS